MPNTPNTLLDCQEAGLVDQTLAQGIGRLHSIEDQFARRTNYERLQRFACALNLWTLVVIVAAICYLIAAN